jgi:tRNA (adenine22-N1)-methyltransferase
MPLKSAEEHITACGLGDKIQTVLSDGLENVQPDGVTDVVIAGMGGEMIAKILSRCDWVKNPNVNLVLQPMTKWDYLRKWLYDNGFEVTEELPCEEGRFVYSVMRVRFNDEGKHDGECDLEYLYFGRVSPDSEEGKKYFLRQAERLETAGRGMLKSPDKFELGKQMLDLADKIKSRI